MTLSSVYRENANCILFMDSIGEEAPEEYLDVLKEMMIVFHLEKEKIKRTRTKLIDIRMTWEKIECFEVKDKLLTVFLHC